MDVISDKVKQKLNDAIATWAEETLAGKPLILKKTVYLCMADLLRKKTIEINESFGVDIKWLKE